MVLFEPNTPARQDLDVKNEQRFVIFWIDAINRILALTCLGEDIGLMSARSVIKRERERYEEVIRFRKSET